MAEIVSMLIRMREVGEFHVLRGAGESFEVVGLDALVAQVQEFFGRYKKVPELETVQELVDYLDVMFPKPVTDGAAAPERTDP